MGASCASPSRGTSAAIAARDAHDRAHVAGAATIGARDPANDAARDRDRAAAVTREAEAAIKLRARSISP